MFEQFSRGYYLGRLYVEPRAGDTAAMCRSQHERVNEQLYAESEGLERLDRPLVMKLESNHFPVHGADDVPADTLAVPEDLIEETDVDNPPTLREVFLAKADRAAQLLQVSGALGWVPDPTGDSEDTGDAGGAGGWGGPDGPAGI